MRHTFVPASALLLFMATMSGMAATYYVDNVGGADGNSGTNAAAAWKNLAKVSSITFQPSDRILFKAGGSWFGQVVFNGSGTDSNPIIVDQYGTGSLPLINGGGYQSAVLLQGVSGWEVNHLEIINDGGATLSGTTNYRAGVLVQTYAAIRSHIYLRQLNVHNIFPETGPEGQGIHVIAYGSSTVNTYYTDVRVENCQISLTGHYGVLVGHNGSAQSNPGYKFNQNILIRSNNFLNTGGSGAETSYADGLVLEGNVVNHSGASVDPRQWARGSGFWPWQCRNVVVQSNQFLHARGPADSCGCHIDYGNSNVVVQYNLSLDNEGGFVEILGGCNNAVYRYNVSINDGSRVKGVNGASQDGHLIWVSDYYGGSISLGSTNSMIYNNTIYVGPTITNYSPIVQRSVNTYIWNNIFFLAGKTAYSNSSSSTILNNNLWYGNLPAGVAFGAADVFTNPLVANAGGTNALDYLLSPVSPAIGAGMVLTNNGGQDYWGNSLPAGAPCIGANERTYSTAAVISVNFTATADTNQQVGAGAAYGVPGENSLVAGWLNLFQTFSVVSLPFSDGFPSTVTMSGSNSGNWNTGNAAYNGTPLLAGAANYTNAPVPVIVTLQNLAANFPTGYKVIVYLGGYIGNTGASITDGQTTFYYQPLAAPVAPVALVPTLATNNPGVGNNPIAQYAVFGASTRLTNDTLMLNLKALSGGGAILGGLQILAAGPVTPHGVPYGWFQGYNLAVDDLADPDRDGVPNWQEYFAATNPTNAASCFKVIDVRQTGGNLALTWLGGTNGYAGNWSMSVSTNLIDWRLLESRTIPRSPSGTNTWVHTNGINPAKTLFYRPCVEYAP